MKKTPSLHFPTRLAESCRKPLLIAVVFSTALLSGPVSHMASADTAETTWSDSGTNWNTSSNWVSGTAPSSTVSAVFNTTTGYANQPTLTIATTTQGIWDTGASGGVTTTIGGSFGLTITGNANLDGVAAAGILLDGAGNNNLTVSSAVTGITISNNTGFYVNNSGTLTVAAPIALGATTLTLGSTTASGNGSIQISGSIGGTGGVKVNDTAGSTSVTLSGNNGYTGATTVNAGTLNLTGTLNNTPVVINGATANFSESSTGSVSGTGTLTLTSGSATMAGSNNYGGATVVNGAMLVTGAMSGTSTFTVGSSGAAGSLTIQGGGVVSNGNNTNSGQMTIGSGAVGMVTVDSSGTLNVAALTYVGYSGTGSLLVENGGKASFGQINEGNVAGSNGNITVNGAGSSLTSGTNLLVGVFGSGALTIENNGSVTSSVATNIGYSGNAKGSLLIQSSGTLISASGGVATGGSSSGIATVTGTGSLWSDAGAMNVASNLTASGTVNVQSGGNVTSSGLVVASGTSSNGVVTITGSGSQWNDTGSITVGSGVGSVGTLTVQNSGTLSTTTTATIGGGTNSMATVTVTGAGSAWNGSGALTIATSGTGIVYVQNQGALSASSIVIAGGTAGTGTLDIGNGGAAGTVSTATITGSSGAASVIFDEIDSAYTFAPKLLGTLNVTQSGTGTTILSASNTYTGATLVKAGKLVVNGSLGNTAVTVGNTSTSGLTPTLGGGIGSGAGTLTTPGNNPSRQVYVSSGSVGNIAGSVTLNGTSAGGSVGILSPGNSGVGTLTVGSLTLSGGSILNYEFNASANDFTVVSGALSLNSGTVGINLYQESTTSQFTTSGTYDLFQYGSLAGSVSNLSVLNPTSGYSYAFGTTTSGTSKYVTLTISSNLTSTTYTLAASADSVNILTGGTTGITATITNTGTGTADSLNYSGLTATTSGTVGNVTGSSTNGGPLASGSSGSNTGLLFSGTQSGSVTITPVGSGSNATLNTAATGSGTTSVTVNVYDRASLGVAQSGTNYAASNASGTFTASALVTGNSLNDAQSGFTNISIAGQRIDPGATSPTLATFDSTGLLNGTYSATSVINFNNVTGSGSSIAGGSGDSKNIGLTATISGHSAISGSAQILSGGGYAGYGLINSGGIHSNTVLLDGIASTTTTIKMDYSNPNSRPTTGPVSSDVVTLTGIATSGTGGGSTTPAGATQSDKYTIEVTFALNSNVSGSATGNAAAQSYYLGWYDPGLNHWVNAIAGNSNAILPADYFGPDMAGQSGTYYNAPYDPATMDVLGNYGSYYDGTNYVAWAVVNHDADYAVIPEPSTWGMILGGFGLLFVIQSLRRRRIDG